jgi:DNA polymerase III delta prime subunit
MTKIDEGMRRNLLTLAGRVKEFWVDGVLKNSLFQAALIDLGMESVDSAVTSPWTTGVTVFDEPRNTTEQLPVGKTITDVFADSAASLLVLGEPGSGKTTTVLRLVSDLIENAQREGVARCPVVFNLSSWSKAGQSIQVWLLGELRDKYSVPTKIGRACLQAGGLLPILDGLDEVSTERRPACVEAINAFAENAWSSGAVVCCRLKEYLALPVRLRLNSAIQLHSLTRDQVLSYVGAGGARLEALAHVLARDSEFLDEAASPLMLNLMIRAYSDVPLEQISAEGTATAGERRKRLMDAYVARMFRRVAGAQQ